MKRLRAAFATGMLILVPVVATVEILRWLVNLVEGTVRNLLPTSLLPFDFSGLGLVMAVVLVLVTGFLAQNYVGRWLVRTVDAALKRLTIVGGIYGAIKKFLETLFQPGDDRFSGVVLVEFPRAGLYSIGFRTGLPDRKLTQNRPAKLVNLFVPCTPNPTSGFYLLVPESELIPVDISVQEAFKIVISMGLVTSDTQEKLPRG